MKWDNIIKPAEIMTEEQAKAYMDSRETSSYQLLDVRLMKNMKKSIYQEQPWCLLMN